MPVTPTSDLAVAASALRTMIAATAAFRSWTGTVDQPSAEARVDLAETGVTGIAILPRARIEYGDDQQSRSVAAGFGGLSSGTLRLVYYAAYVAATSIEDQIIALLNNGGAVNQELLDATGGLLLREINRDGEVTLPDMRDSDAGLVVRAAFRVGYGLDGSTA